MSGKPGQKTTKEVIVPRGYSLDALNGLDGRCRTVKEVKARFRQLVSDQGGIRDLSYQRQSLTWRAVFLESWIEEQERKMVLGEAIDESKWLASLGTFTSLLSRIGLERRARTITPLQRLRAQPTAASGSGAPNIVGPGLNGAAEQPDSEIRHDDYVIEVSRDPAS